MLSDADRQIASDILTSSDVTHAVVSTEAITEPNAAPGTTRVIQEKWESAIVGKRYVFTHSYISGPDSPAWGGQNDPTEAIENLA